MKWAKSGIYGYLQIGSGDNSSFLRLMKGKYLRSNTLNVATFGTEVRQRFRTFAQKFGTAKFFLRKLCNEVELFYIELATFVLFG